MIRTLPLLVLLAACGDQVAVPGADLVGADSCNASQFSALVGTPVGDGSAFLASAATYRTLYPNDAATTDLDPDRINVNVDDSGIIKSLTCG